MAITFNANFLDSIEEEEKPTLPSPTFDDSFLPPLRGSDVSSLHQNLLQVESGNQHFDEQGGVLTSPAGAEGAGQLMPQTQVDPGFGVTPLQDDTPEENRRFSRDYLVAMLGEFEGDQAKALAAYNAGPGRVKELTQKYGESWLEHAPQETKDYVQKLSTNVNANVGVNVPEFNEDFLPPLRTDPGPVDFPALSEEDFDIDIEQDNPSYWGRKGKVFMDSLKAIPGSLWDEVTEGFGRNLEGFGGADVTVDKSTIPGKSWWRNPLAPVMVRALTSAPGDEVLDAMFPALGEGIREYGEGVADESLAQKKERTARILGPNPDLVDAMIYNAVQSLGVSAPSIAGQIVTRGKLGTNTLLAPIVGYTTLSAHNELREKDMEGNLSLIHAGVEGAIEGVFERLPVKYVLGDLDGPFVKRVLKGLAAEVPGEMATTVLQGINREVAFNPEMTWDEVKQYVTSEQMKEELIVTAGASVLGLGLQAGTIQGIYSGGKLADRALFGKFETREVEDVAAMEAEKKRLKDEFDVQRFQDENEEAIIRYQSTQEGFSQKLKEVQAENASETFTPVDLGTGSRYGPLDIMNADPNSPDVNLAAAGQQYNVGTRIRENGKNISLSERTNKAGETLVLSTDILSPLGVVESGERFIKNMEREIQVLLQNVENVTYGEREVVRERIQSFERMIDNTKEDIRKNQTQAEKQKSLVQGMVNTVNSLRNNFMRGTQEISVTNDPAPLFVVGFETLKKKTTKGLMGAFRTQEGVPVYRIRLNTNLLKEDNVESEVAKSLSHEVGHALFDLYYRNAPQHVQAGLDASWRSLVSEHLDKPFKEFAQRAMGPARLKHMTEVRPEVKEALDSGVTLREFARSFGIDPTDADYLDYALGRQEFFAENMYKKAARKGTVGDMFEKEFEGFRKETRQLAASIKAHYQVDSIPDTLLNLNEMWARTLDTFAQKTIAQKRLAEGVNDLLKNPITMTVGQRHGGLLNKFIKNVEVRKHHGDGVDRFNKFIENVYGIVHWAELHPHIPQVGRYVESHTERNYFAMKQRERANETIRLWTKTLPRKDWANMTTFMFEADARSEALGRALEPQEIVDLMKEKKLNLSNQHMQVAEAMWGYFRESVTLMEQELLKDVERRYRDDPTEMGRLMRMYRRQFRELRDRNYMPHTRFGQYAVYVKATGPVKHAGETYDRDTTISFEMYETEGAQKKAKARWEKALKGQEARVQDTYITDEHAAFQGFPPQMIEYLMSSLDMTETQRSALEEFLHKQGPAQSFRKHLLTRKGTEGYDTDALRVFGDYASRFANHISRVKYKPEQMEILQNFADANSRRLNSTTREKMRYAMEEHQRYVDNPGNEWATLRSVGFIFYLGFVPKSALVNLTQVPMVAFPWLSNRTSTVAATAALAQAMKDTASVYNKGKQWSAEEVELQRNLAALLEESAATELAATHEGNPFRRVAPGALNDFFGDQQIAGWVKATGKGAAFMFQKAEQFNRTVTAIAAYRLARSGGKNITESTKFAQDAVRGTQFEYTRFNRAKMMRGKKSIVFLFWQYLTNMSFYMWRDPSRWQYLVQLALVSGLMGLPGAENLDDILSAVITKLRGKKTDLELEARKGIEQILEGYMPWFPFSADTVMHGAASNVGPWDLSASISMGRMLPATEYLAMEGMKGEQQLTGALTDMSGATVEMFMGMYRAVASDSPDVWRKWEQALPTQGKNLSKTLRRAVRGEETTLYGDTVKTYDPDSLNDRLELAGQALGFPPKEIRVTQEARYKSRQFITYYQTKATLKLSNLYYYVNKNDGEGIEHALEDIRKFNESVPEGVIGISMSDVMQSIKNRQKSDLHLENNIYPQKKYRGLYQEVYETYNEGNENK